MKTMEIAYYFLSKGFWVRFSGEGEDEELVVEDVNEGVLCTVMIHRERSFRIFEGTLQELPMRRIDRISLYRVLTRYAETGVVNRMNLKEELENE